jgi:hypothetical protein
MTIYKKLQDARILLQNTKLTKSGKNKFAGYEYFELGDFLPAIQTICQKVGLCGVVSFNTEMAYLTIYDAEDASQFVTFTSPMSTAQLKGCHDVQNLGAVQTYLRRYLWTNAFEIVEHDALDATTGDEKVTPKPTPKPTPKVEPKKIEGQKGEFQIVAPAKPDSPDAVEAWLDHIKVTSEAILAFAENEDDILAIFKKNKVLFDTVKEADPEFFKDLMAIFTATKNSLKG